MSIDCHAYPLERFFGAFIVGLITFLPWHSLPIMAQSLILLSSLLFLFYKKLYSLIFFVLLGALWAILFQEREPEKFKAMGGSLQARVDDSQIVHGQTKRRTIEMSVQSFTSHDQTQLTDFKALFEKPRELETHFHDQISCQGSLVPVSSQLASDQAYIKHLHLRGIFWMFIPLSEQDIKIVPQQSLQKSILNGRDNFLDRLEQQLRNERNYTILTAMLFGLKQELSSSQKDTLRRSGLMHIFAVSGLHVGIVAFILLWLMRLLLIPVWWRFSLLPIILIPYLIMTGLPASALRAWVMISIWSIGLCLSKSSISLNSLYAAGFVILLFDPNQVLLAGFQFSFLVIFALLMSLKPLDELCKILDEKINWGQSFSYHRHHLKNKILKTFGITFVAYMSSLGMNIYLSANSNPFSLLVNLICIFLAAPLMACALLSSALPFLNPLLNSFTDFFAGLANMSSQFSLKLGDLPGIVCALYSLAFLMILRLRPTVKTQMILLSSLLFSLILFLQWNHDDEAIIIFRGTGQEQVSLAIFEKDRSLLINCSDFQAASFFINECDKRGLSRIDLLICDNRKNSSLGSLSLLNKQRLQSLTFLNPRSTPTQFQQYLHQQSFEMNCPLYFSPPLHSPIQKINTQSFTWGSYEIEVKNSHLGKAELSIRNKEKIINRSLAMANYPQIEIIPLQ